MKDEWTQTVMRFYFGWKSHFGVQSALYLCSHELRRNETQNGMDFISVILTEMKFQTGMRFSCEQNLPEAKLITRNSLDIAFNAHVRLKLIAGVISLRSFWQKWNFISGDKISCKHYRKWNHMKGNICTCVSKNDWLLTNGPFISDHYRNEIHFISPAMEGNVNRISFMVSSFVSGLM